ncbi:MAG: hypothetical protein ACKOUT_12715, partial [Novosphingobium sp.]
MTVTKLGGALALPLALYAVPAAAQEMTSDEISVMALRPDSHGPAGTMADHVHKRGDLMIGLSWMHEEASGTNRSGTADIPDAAVIAAGFTSRTRSMTMDMAMLHVMWAPSDRVTLMAVPSWQTMDMSMIGLVTATHHGHTLAAGEAMQHRVSGIGDTQVGALVALSRNPHLSVIAGMGVSIPTGSVTRKDDDGNFVHYGMQPGSGTWDLLPSFTLRGSEEQFGWGVQASYVFRAEGRGTSGFRFGDRFVATGWLSRPVARSISLSTRLTWTDEGAVQGHYNAGHNHAAPPDRQANYGGQR